MNNFKHCSFYKHYAENGRRVMVPIDLDDMQDILHVLHSQRGASDLTTLDDQPQSDGWLDE